MIHDERSLARYSSVYSVDAYCRSHHLRESFIEMFHMITRQEFVDRFDIELLRLINKPIREINGKNRSPDIDSWNRRTGVAMGSPYCASSIWCELFDVCAIFGLIFPMNPTASSQNFATYPPRKYIRAPGQLGKKGDAAILQLPNKPTHGHLVVLSADQEQGTDRFHTREFNTSPAGSRDGDGGYSLIRSTIDGSRLNNYKNFRCFADIPQWIIDFNTVG